MTTKGQYRVGIRFNPSNNGTVDRIKQLAAELIDLIEAIPGSEMRDLRGSEVGRLKALAQTAAEDAAMWAVKAATKPAPDA